MVKNTGGNKAKKLASKTFNVVVRATRFASIKGEVYAIVTKMMGGSICEVLCIDGITRQCVIRRKFSGKGRRDNWLCRGKWILVGLRDWENTSKAKETCDLLEVYSDNDKEKLIKNSKENFRIFLSVTGDGSIELNIQELKTISHYKLNIKTKPTKLVPMLLNIFFYYFFNFWRHIIFIVLS